MMGNSSFFAVLRVSFALQLVRMLFVECNAKSRCSTWEGKHAGAMCAICALLHETAKLPKSPYIYAVMDVP